MNALISNVLSITVNNTSAFNLIKLLAFIALLVVTGIYIKQYRIGSTSASSRGFWAAFISVILAHDFSRIIIDVAMESEMLTTDNSRYLERFVFEAIILVFNLLAYYLIYKLTTYYAQKEELARLRQRQSDIMSEVARANQMYDEMRVLRHEFKNNMLTVRGLSKTKQYDKLDQYLSSYLKTDGMALGYIDCGNRVLNNILNFKYADLTSRGVAFNHKVSVPEELPYDESDITSLLVNLIDNAAEAGLKTESPSVDMNVIVEKGYCFITVINPVRDDILNENPTLQTTKKDKKSHGIGLKVVRNIVDKYDGYVNFEQKGGEFIASVMLSLG
jgi:sensor histidine kinase YesM